MTARLIAVALCVLLTAPASGQSPLRWKLTPGEKLLVQTQQKTESLVAFDAKATTTRIDLGMELLWSVVAAEEDKITFKQTIQRIQFQFEAPPAGVIQFDSAAAAKPPAGRAREVAAAIGPLVGAEVEIEMNTRGEILAARPINAAAEALLAGRSSPSDEGGFSPQSIQQLLRQPLVVLPEKTVGVGDEWTKTSPLSAAAGEFVQTTTYRLAGTARRDDQQLAQIEFASKFEPKSPPVVNRQASKGKLAVKSHQQTGTVLFSADQGRLVEAEQKQKLVTERPYRETRIVVTLSSEQKTTVKPAEM